MGAVVPSGEHPSGVDEDGDGDEELEEVEEFEVECQVGLAARSPSPAHPSLSLSQQPTTTIYLSMNGGMEVIDRSIDGLMRKREEARRRCWRWRGGY